MQTRYAGSAALALLFALVLSACGTTQQATPAAPAADATAAPAAAATAAPAAAATADGMAGMDHGQMGDGTAPYDAQFIDSMTVHHQSALTMAKQALTEAERPELKQLAEGIVAAQDTEIAQMQGWRSAWYPNLAPSSGMGMDMGTMEVSPDTAKPFDQRFIEAMIPHHEGAIMMAKDAQQKAERPEIKQLAGEIITAQEAEITQMKQWQQAWFGS